MNKNILCKEIRLDVTTSCNLSCPLCPNTLRRNKKYEEKYIMPLEYFQRIADNLDFCLERISVGAKHEPLINKDIFKMIKYLHSKQPKINISILSNFNLAFEPCEISGSGVSEIVIGMDGIDQKSYSKYRVGGNFDTVIDNIIKLQNYKKNNNIKNPDIIISFIVFSHNEHLTDKAKKFFNSMGVNVFFRCTDRYDGYENWLPKNFHNERIDLKQLQKDNKILCDESFKMLAVNAYGNVYPCCAEEALNYSVGNIFKDKLSTIWNGEKIKNIRNFMTNNSYYKDIPCVSCPVYKNNGYTSYDKFEN